MPEIQSTTSRGGQTGKWTGLLATKIHIPELRPDLLPRPHLITHLEEATFLPLTLLSAPAGFGKTTQLAVWARKTAKPVAWFSIDDGDGDPARFWRYMTAAVERVYPGACQNLSELLADSDQANSRAMASTLINDLDSLSGDLVVILDDYHLIEGQKVNESLAYFIEHLAPAIHLVISGRSDPPLPLARLRGRGQLAELRVDDLRFDREEVLMLLTRIWGIDLHSADIDVLTERTEGWVTGLQLAALSLKGASDPDQFIRNFTGSQRYVLDYLTEEVLNQQQADVSRFLLETSIVEQLCSSLCEALTGRKDSQDMLEYLERSNLFVVPLDQQRHWYRYHNLFASLLRTRLQSGEPDRMIVLHGKASAWYAANGMVDAAIQHAMAAGEVENAARLVEQHEEEALSRGEGHTLRRWLVMLPADKIRTHPRLALVQAIANSNSGQLQGIEPLLREAEQAFKENPMGSYEPSIGKELSMLVNIPASIALLRSTLAALQGDADRATRLAHTAQMQMTDDERGPRISTRWNLAQADWLRGRLDEASRVFTGIIDEGKLAGATHLVLSASDILGRIQRAQGHLGSALNTYRESLDFATSRGVGTSLSTASAYIGLAGIFYERNLLDEALSHASEGVKLGRQLTSTQPLAMGLIILAQVKHAMGDVVSTREALDEAYHAMPDPGIVALFNPVPASRARMMLAQGEIEAVSMWLSGLEIAPDIQVAYSHEPDYLVLAGYLLKKGQIDGALTLLRQLEMVAREQGRWQSLIEIETFQALGLQAAGKTSHAVDILAQVLQLAEPERYRRLFIDAGDMLSPMSVEPLLERCRSRFKQSLGMPGLVSNEHLVAYVDELLDAFKSQNSISQLHPHLPGERVTHKPLKPVILSSRELEVLHLIASGASNQEIAGTLIIALSTARKHVSNIIGKLGVKNRTQAVARGRDLGLL